MFTKSPLRLGQLLLVFAIAFVGFVGARADAESTEYEVGGPLAGVKLPLFPTQQGEAPGYPGSIDELAKEAQKENPESTRFTPEGNTPVRELRPGSPELYMAYMDKYMPVRSMLDKQTLVQLFETKDLKLPVEQYAAPLYWVGRHNYGEPTGRFWSPQPVVRMTASASTVSLQTKELKPSLYCVKLIGAVESEHLQKYRKPLILSHTITQGSGKPEKYLNRVGYVDEFYSVSEVYFHVGKANPVNIEIALDARSQVPLLVHAVELHDVMAGTIREPRKTRMTLTDTATRDRQRAKVAAGEKINEPNVRVRAANDDDPKLSREERLRRDEQLWNAWIPLNAQPGGAYGRQGGYATHMSLGAEGKTPKQINEEHGGWKVVGNYRSLNPEEISSVLMKNEKLGLEYTMDDLRANRPLPDPYPYKADGTGIFTPANGDAQPQHFSPVAEAVGGRAYMFTQFLNWYAVPSYHFADNKQLGRDAAIMLIRLAYDWPTIDGSKALSALLSCPAGYGRDLHARQRHTSYYNWPWYTQYHYQAINYDRLFDLIDGNEELAQSVNRFIPWVKTSKDLITLLDTYLVQHTAKRILRYNWHTGEMKLAIMATVQDDREITDPWMDWLFKKTWVYPLPTSGIADLMVTGCGRNGPEYIASTFYAQGENALAKASELEPYVNAGGNPKYNLSDPYKYPKPVMMCYWPMDVSIAGRHTLRIGDVAGPDKGNGYRLDGADEHFMQGWKWTQDPKFAWFLKHEVGRRGQNDAEWAAIEAAGKTIDRPPYLDNPSRAMTQWASILETGRHHDDYRFRRTVSVRTGMGWGHHHNDTLDLQVNAHGVPMTVDGGQRPGYSKPADRETRMHNLVEVDGLGDRDGQWLGHSWTNALVDSTGAQYMRLQAAPPHNQPHVKSYRRQVALIDVDEGKGSTKLKPEQFATNAKLPLDVETANSYIFDVVRVDGGRRHTYCFHATTADEVTTNASNVVPFDNAAELDQQYIRRMAGERSVGSAPDHFTTDFLMKREREGYALGEKIMLRDNLTDDAPRKHTKLHLFGVEGQTVLRGSLDCVKWKYQIPMVFVQKRSEDELAENAKGDLQSAYVAIIEPYVGKPFIKSAERLTIANAGDAADQPVAMRVNTVNGHTDLCFSDGKAGAKRSVAGGSIVGEYAYHSVDSNGLRQATLVGGTLLQIGDLKITADKPEQTATVTSVDYGSKSMTVTGNMFMPGLTNRTFEVGKGDHWTTYTTTKLERQGDATNITVRGGADFYLSRVKEVDTADNTVYCGLGFAQNEGHPSPGITSNWVASNEEGTKFWRAEYLGGDRASARYGFKLDGPVSEADFGENGGLRLWEYGVGDTVRQSTHINLRRIADGKYELTADTGVSIELAGKTHKVTVEQLEKADGKVIITTK